MQSTEYLIKADGSIHRRDVSENELQQVDTIVNELCANAPRKVRQMFEADDLSVHMCLTGNLLYFTSYLPGLTFLASFKAVKGIMVPSFNNKADPQMTLGWTPPEGSFLKLVVAANSALEFRVAHLFLYDSKGAAYRMPLPNLHDDCKICMGEFDWHSQTYAELVHRCMRQLKVSPWNSDLLKSAEQSQNFFRWKPVNEKFEILPPNGDNWTKLCAKVSVPIMEFIV